VWVDGSEVGDGAGSIAFGSTPTGVPVTRTIAVRNVGSETLNLAGAIALPACFGLVSGFTATSLAPAAVATFVVRMDATAPGDFGGRLSFGTNDVDESEFDFTVSGNVAAARVIDDGAAGFAVSGALPTITSQGYQGDARRLYRPSTGSCSPALSCRASRAPRPGPSAPWRREPTASAPPGPPPPTAPPTRPSPS
jgi:hypothetical protein